MSIAQPKGVIQYGPLYKASPVLILLCWLALLLWIRVVVNPPPERSEGAPYVLAVFLLVALVLPWLIFIEVFGTEAFVSAEGLQMKSFWRGMRFLRWSEVETVYYSVWRDCYVIEGLGTRIVLNENMRGLSSLAEAVNSRLPTEKWIKDSGRIRLLLPKGPYD